MGPPTTRHQDGRLSPPTASSALRCNQQAKIIRSFESSQAHIFLRHVTQFTNQTDPNGYLGANTKYINLQDHVPDPIIWRWTDSGDYSTKTACEAQFRGTFAVHNFSVIWKAQAESKCRFFAWLAVQRKLLTADDNFERRGWPHIQVRPHCAHELDSRCRCRIATAAKGTFFLSFFLKRAGKRYTYDFNLRRIKEIETMLTRLASF